MPNRIFNEEQEQKIYDSLKENFYQETDSLAEALMRDESFTSLNKAQILDKIGRVRKDIRDHGEKVGTGERKRTRKPNSKFADGVTEEELSEPVKKKGQNFH